MQAMLNFMLHINKFFSLVPRTLFLFQDVLLSILFRESAFLYHDVSFSILLGKVLMYHDVS